MAEFCLECWNKLNKTNDSAKEYIISKELSLCEECNEYKHVIVTKRKYYYMRKFRFFILPFEIIYRILTMPYLIYKYQKHKKK